MSFIEAAPVGLIKPYVMGICLSRFTKAHPNMTKMFLDVYKQTKPAMDTNFNLTMQLNRNYSARLHVNKSNHGLPYIAALGVYPGGRHSYYTVDQASDLPL